MSQFRTSRVRLMAMVACALVLVAAQSASASILGSYLARPDTPGEFVINQLNDTNREQFLPQGQDVDRTDVRVDDQFKLFLKFENITSYDAGPTYGGDSFSTLISGDYQLWGIGLFTVTNINPIDAVVGTFDLVGEVKVYETIDPAKNIANFLGGPAAMEATILTMDHIATFATSDPSDYIRGLLPLDLTNLPTNSNPQTRVATEFGMTQTADPGNLMLTREAVDSGGLKFDLTGTTDLWAASQAEQQLGWFAQSDTTATVAAIIPEPSSLVIMSLLAGIFGLVAIRRRK